MEEQQLIHSKNDHHRKNETENSVAQSGGLITPLNGVQPISIPTQLNSIQRLQALPENERPEGLRPNVLQRLQALPENERPEGLRPNIIQRLQALPENERPEHLRPNLIQRLQREQAEKNQVNPFGNPFGNNNTLQLKSDKTATKTATKQKKQKAPTIEENKKTQIMPSSSSVSSLVVNIHDKPYRVEFTDSLPEPIRKGLKNHAGTLLFNEENHPGSFPEYSTTSFAISGKDFGYKARNLKKYKGTTVFEFTRLKNDDKDGAPVFQVKELGKDVAPNLSDKDKLEHKTNFESHFTLDKSFTDAKEIEILYNTVAKIPDSLLSQISGVNFKRDSVNTDDPQIAGLHELGASGRSTITLYNLAFKDKSFIRFGDEKGGFSTALQFTIVHEIGHAMDSRKVKKSLLGKSAASKKSNDDNAELMKESVAMGKMQGNTEAYTKAYKKAVESNILLADKKKDVNNARTETGFGLVEKSPTEISFEEKNAKTAFREAIAKDGGLSISDYGETKIRESFAEFFSYYILDGERLKRLRPAVYEYFSATFPKK